MESTTNQTLSDTENNITRMSDKLSGGSERKLIAPSHWSSDQSECNGSLSSTIKGKRKTKTPIKSPSRLLKDSEMGCFTNDSNLSPLQLVWAKCRFVIHKLLAFETHLFHYNNFIFVLQRLSLVSRSYH